MSSAVTGGSKTDIITSLRFILALRLILCILSQIMTSKSKDRTMDWQKEMAIALCSNDQTQLKQTIALKPTDGLDSNDRLILNQMFFRMFETQKCSLELIRVFIEAGVDVNSRDDWGNTPLALCERDEFAQLLLDFKANVNALNANNKGPLQLAIENQRTDIAKLLIKNGARCQIGDLTSAAGWCQDVSLIEMLVNIGSDVNEHDRYGSNPLLDSVRNFEPKLVDFLIKSGADVNAVEENEYRRTALILTQILKNRLVVYDKNDSFRIMRERNLSVVISILLKAGANVNACDASGRTALMLCRSASIAELLIENGADVNHTILDENNRQLSVLSEMLSRSESVSQVLLRHGALVNEDDLVRLMSSSQFSSSNPLSLQLFDQILNSGANVNARNDDGLTPLMLCRNITLAEKLIEKGADVHATCIMNSKDFSALSLAIEHNCTDMIDFLLTYGSVAQPADLLKALQRDCDDDTLALLISSCPRKNEFINMRDKNGKSPLMLCRSADSAHMLLELGADVNARISDEARDNITVLMDRVKRINEISVAKTLLEAGADVNAVSRLGVSVMSQLLKSLCAVTYDFQWDFGLRFFDLLTEHGAKITKEYKKVFAMCIEKVDFDAIELLVTKGVVPVTLELNDQAPFSASLLKKMFQFEPLLSPCCLALLNKNVKLARYFREINFLTLSDVTQMPKALKTIDLGEEVYSFIDDMLHQPISLFRLSFIAVSALVGPAPGREERVQELKIPPSLQRKLLFQDLNVKLRDF